VSHKKNSLQCNSINSYNVPVESARRGVPEKSTRSDVLEEPTRPGVHAVTKIRCSCALHVQLVLLTAGTHDLAKFRNI
jgi:hypothetical protein